MNRASGVLIAVPAFLGLAWLSAHAMAVGAAGSRVFDAGIEMRASAAPRAEPLSNEALLRMRESLLQADSVTPRDPALHELLALVDIRRGELQDAASQLRVAIALRPTSPQTWADLAAVQYRLGDTGPMFETSLERASELGRFEPDVQAIVANYGLAVWNEAKTETQRSTEATIAAAMKRNPLEMLQIAQRRGRLDVACRHLAGTTRQVDSKWSQLCQSMEATS